MTAQAIWTTPRDWAFKDTLDVGRANAYLRDNQEYLLRRPYGYLRYEPSGSILPDGVGTWYVFPMGSVTVYTETGNIEVRGIIPIGDVNNSSMFDIYNVTEDYFLSSLTNTPLADGLTAFRSANNNYRYAQHVFAVDEGLSSGQSYEYEIWYNADSSSEITDTGRLCQLFAKEI